MDLNNDERLVQLESIAQGMLTGEGLVDIAARLGLDMATLSDLRRSPEYRVILGEMKREVREQTDTTLIGAGQEAVRALHRILVNHRTGLVHVRDGDAIRAAKTTLDLIYNGVIDPTAGGADLSGTLSSISTEDLEKFVESFEARDGNRPLDDLDF